MANLQSSRNKLKVAVAVMIVANVAAAAILFSPLAGSAESRRQLINQLTFELAVKTRGVEPLRGMDKKVDVAKQQIGQFYNARFATRDSDIADELGKLAQQNGVHILQARYKQEDPEPSGVVPVTIDGDFSGDYLSLVRFINALERSKLFYMVDSVGLVGETTGPVRLDVRLHSYLKSGA